jgi:predicted transcriptional regulator
METIKKIIKSIEKTKGPAPSFSFLDVINILEIIWKTSVIGRQKLSIETGLGEGSVRTIIKWLKKWGLIETTKLGCKLTKKGKYLIQGIKSKIGPSLPVSKSFLAIGDSNVGVLVKGVGDKVKNGIEQRDAAIKAGATAATTIIFRKKSLILPSITNSINKEWPKLAEEIYRTFQPKENDVIIICSAKNKFLAEKGAIAAAWSLIE